ncbi:MAG: EAL domain-containing protein, partial [Pseudolabrys sp.]
QSLAHVGSFSVDLSNNHAHWSEECFKILGFDPQAIAPSFETYLARIHPDDRGTFEAAYRRSLDARTEGSLEQRILLDDGRVRVVQQRWRHQYGPDGKPLITTGTVQDITERKATENAIIQERDFSHAMIGSLPGLFVLIDEHGRLMRWNGNVPTLTGLSEDQLQGADVPSLVVEGDREKARAAISGALTGGYVDVVLGVPTNTGEVRLVHWVGRPVAGDGQRTLIAIGIDETEERATQTNLKASEERFRSVTDAAQDAIIIIDSAGTINYWNPAASRILGYSAEEAFGKNVHEWLTPERFREKAFAGMKKFVATGRGDVLGTTTELAALRKDGVEIPIELSVGAMQLGAKLHAVAILRDIAERKRTEERIAYLARHDDLTGLLNRAAFVDGVNKAIANAKRKGTSFSIFYLGLDHFRDINETLGNPIGDLLLQTVAGRLRAACREEDGVARLGSDEFALLMTDGGDSVNAAALAGALLTRINERFMIEGTEVHIGASIGISISNQNTSDVEALLSQCDVALRRAKSEERGTYRFFTGEMDREVRARVQLRDELRDAVRLQQFVLFYQPQVDVNTGEIIGVEALVRWNHPIEGMRLPGSFIPLLEETGLIVPLGSWVIHEAGRQMKVWLDAGIAPPLISMNVSMLQLMRHPTLETVIFAMMTETAIPPARLELELLEGALFEKEGEHGNILARIRKMGLRIAIDDFGTGYSSLAYLSQFPIDRIKIAREFVSDITTKGSINATIVRTAIGMAHEMGLDVIMEGVETAEQVEMLRSWNCHKVQGFYYSKPLPVDEITLLLRQGKIRPAISMTNETAQ